MRILAVAQNTFREAVRDKILYMLVVFAIVAIVGSKALGWVSVGQDIKIVKNLSLAAVLLFGVLISIFVGTSLIHKEVDKRTIYTILSCPVARYEFVLGKYLGLALLLALVTMVMGTVASGFVLIQGGQLAPVFFQALFLIYMELLLITAVAMLMSSLASPILGAVVVFCVFVTGNGTGIFTDLPSNLESPLTRRILEFLYYVIPNLSNFNLLREAPNDVPVAWSYVLWATVYGVVYSAMFLGLAIIAFQRKDV